MKLSDISQTLLIQSGTYILGSLSDVQLNIDALWRMLRPEFDDYQKFKPIKRRYTIGPTSALATDLTNDPNNGSNGPPVFLSSVVPVGWVNFISMQSLMASGTSMDKYNIQSPNRLVAPRTFLWDYQTNFNGGNFFITSEMGSFDITANFRYEINITKTAGLITEVDIAEFDDNSNPILWDILRARFMMSIGLARRSFTYQDLPLTVDAAQVVAESQVLYDKAREALYARHDWSGSLRA